MISGILEILIITLFTNKYFYSTVGLITIIPAYFSYIHKTSMKRNYLTAILLLIKYNPFSMAFFLIMFADTLNPNPDPQIRLALSILPLMLILISAVFIMISILIIVWTNRINKAFKVENGLQI